MLQQLPKHIQDKVEKLLSSVGDMALKRRARRIIEEINPQSNEKIIDLGCGTGYYLYLFNNLPVNLKLTGFDFDKKALDEAKTMLSDEKIDFVLGDMHKISFKNNSFDKAVSSEALEHLKDDTQALREVFRILKPGGTLVVSVPSINYPFLWDPINWVLQHFFNTHIKTGFFSGFWSGHIRLYFLKDLKDKFEKAGFKVEVAEELTFWCLPFNHYLVNIVARLLYDVKISPKIADKLSKFKESKKPFIIDLVFKIVNCLDSFNEIFPQKTGVNVFIKAIKNH
ncbi:MAG: methyltransferase domain-containing protein [Candidatus Daviesbacteria bacterium]|nr:methyltransferase domain-containing protein [Candidatus Daviesbacteria bacterium]